MRDDGVRFTAICLALLIIAAIGIVIAEDNSLPDGTIYGHVYDVQAKQPISQAWVYCQEAKCSKQTTDSEGYYAIENCFSPSSTYFIQCTKNGYPTAKNTAKTDSSGKVKVDFNLGITQNPPPKPDSNQTQVKSWKKTFSRSTSDIGWSVQQTTDGGYIIAASTTKCNYRSVWLIRTDEHGNKLWSKAFGDSCHHPYIISSIQQIGDGGYIIVGYILKEGQPTLPGDYGNDDAWLLMTDSHGNELWNRTFSGSGTYKFNSIKQTNDGGYIIAGSTVIKNHYADAWLIKIDSQGNKLWDKTFGGSKSDEAKAVLQTSDGGYIIAGYTISFVPNDPHRISPSRAGWLIRTDSQGNRLWDKTLMSNYTNDGEDSLNSIQLTNDGGYIAAGYAKPGNCAPSLWLVKIDPRGNKQWDDVFFCAGDEDIGSSVQQTNDGGYIIVGLKHSDIWLIKTNSQGNYGQPDFNTKEINKWDRTFGGSEEYCGNSVQQTNDGGYIVAGTATWYTDGAQKSKVVLIKTDSEGN